MLSTRHWISGAATVALLSYHLFRAGPTSGSTDPPLGSGSMFDEISQYYDLANTVMSLGQDQNWRYRLLVAMESSHNADYLKSDLSARQGKLLDLATGSGDVAIMAAERFMWKSVVGVDPSKNMLSEAKRKCKEQNLDGYVSFMQGDAQDMRNLAGVQTHSFNAITMAFGIRNVPDRFKALAEMKRLCIADPKVCRIGILEFGTPSAGGILSGVAKYFVRYFVPLMGGLITGKWNEYSYLEKSIFEFPTPEKFEDLMASAGLQPLKVDRYLGGVVNLYVATVK